MTQLRGKDEHGGGHSFVADVRVADRPDESEQRVVRQLVEALLFEGLVPFHARQRGRASPDPHAPPELYDLEVSFESGRSTYRCLAAVKSFGRVRVAQGSVQRWVAGDLQPCRLYDLVASLDTDHETKRRLLAELGQTVDLCRWNREHLAHHVRPRRALGFLELESAIVEGHLYHPSFKARTGFSLRDHAQFGPEASNRFQLEWLALPRPFLSAALPQPEATFWTRELGEREYAALGARLSFAGGAWSDYALVPVHPWQLGSIRALPGVDRAIDAKELIPLGSAGDFYQATQSLRTLANVSRPERANVKLPLNVVCTSLRRNLESHFVCTAPALSEWLGTLAERDPFLRARDNVVLLKEYAGLLYEPAPAPGDFSERSRHLAALQGGLLGAVYRESILGKLRPGEAAVPFTAMMIVESDGRPFIADWLAVHGVRRWLVQLIEVVVLPIWHFLVHHGVALEAHPQNLILLHRQGWPERLALRDFHDATEYVDDFLAQPELLPRLERIDPFFETVADDDGYRMARVEDLRELFMDTIYVFNLADLAFMLERFGLLREHEFWSLVRERLSAYAQSGVTAHHRIARVGSDSPEIAVESLLRKKLMGGGSFDYYEHRVENSLRG